MSKTKIEIRAGVPVIVFPCGGCRPCGHAEYEIIKELEQQNKELIEIAREYSYLLLSQQTYDFNNEHDLKRGEDIEQLLRKHTEEAGYGSL